MFQWPGREGRPQAIIVDEAHRLEHEATSAFTVEVNQSELLQMTKAMSQLQGIGALFYLLAQSETEKGDSNETINHIRSETLKTANQIKDYFDVLISRIEILMKNRPRYQSIYWNEMPWWKSDQPPGEIEKSIYKHFEYTYMALLQYYELLLPYSVRFGPANLSDDQMMMAYGRFESFFSQVSDMVDNLKICLTFLDDYSMVLRFHEKEGFSLEAGPVNVGKIVHEKLLATSQAVVMTSATLANMQGTIGVQGMEWVTGHLYLPPEKRFKKPLFIPPLYDYGNKAKVFLCDDVPFHQDREYVPTIMKKLIPMVEAIEGKSLFLFSSRERFERAREILLDKLDGIIPIFVQGMGISVVEEFKRTGSGVLIGMELFGEGIDIPGNALQFVFIDKVPDLRMEKVISDRREFFDRSFGNEFSEYYLAARARSLQQKLGRLLRTETDFGGALIADPRIKSWKGRTSEKWNELMLPYKIERQDLQTACDEIVKFIKET
jgi:ATP-dependent DNA helicase DinG